MRPLPSLLLLLALAPAWSLAAPTSVEEPLGLVAVPVAQRDLLSTTELMVEGGSRTHLHAHATASDRQLLDSLGVSYSVLTTDVALLRPERDPSRGGGYHTPETMAASLRALAQTYPEIARVVDVGTSVEGRELTGVVLSDLPGVRELGEPSWRVLGTHHGDEWSSMEVAHSVAWTLAAQYGVDPGVTSLIDEAEVWIVPVINPDGVEAFTRRNARSVDLNRNYSFEWRSQTASGSAPFSEPESDAVRLLSRTRSFGHSLSMHSGATNLGWVWNWSLADTDDEDVLAELCARYLAANPQPDFWITNGAAWYITYGDTNDWSYGVRGGHDYTLEISDEKAPPESELPDYLDWHTQPSIDFMVDGATTGIVGFVTGPDGEPVEATLRPGAGAQAFYSDPETGGFARPVGAGTIELLVEAAGYGPATVSVAVNPIGAGATSVPVSLSTVSPVEILSAVGLATPADTVGEAVLWGEEVLSHHALGGTFALHRPGLGTWPVDASIQPGAKPAIALDLDPLALIYAWDRVGEWSVVLHDGVESVDVLPLAVAMTTPDPDLAVTALSAAPAAEGGYVLEVSGDALPVGAQLRLVGPLAGRYLPVERYADVGEDHAESLSALFDPSDWPDGAYQLRIQGGGELVAIDESILVLDGVMTAEYVPPVGDDDDDSTDPVDDDDSTAAPVDDDDSALPPDPGSGCQGCAGNSGSGTLALLALLIPSSVRRRRASP